MTLIHRVIPPKIGPSALSRQLPVPADSLTLALSQRERVGVRVFMVKGEAPRFMNIPVKTGIQSRAWAPAFAGATNLIREQRSTALTIAAQCRYGRIVCSVRPFILFVLFILFLTPSAWGQSSLEKAVISYPSRSIASVDLFIAQERGYFREEGLDTQLVQVRGTIAVPAALTGDVQAIAGVGTVIRAVQRSDIPFKVLAINLKRPLFWLVTRPEFASISALKGKILGTTTLAGAQHVAAARLLRKGGLDPDKDITVIVAGDVPTQLQSLVAGAIQIAALSPPTVILARDKFKMRILASAVEEFPSLQNGIAVSEKLLRERREFVKRILRARAKANRYFWESERGASEILAKYLKVDSSVALESYRLSQPAFTRNGIPTDKEIEEFLKLDAEFLKLPEPSPPSKIFDFSLQREVNREIPVR